MKGGKRAGAGRPSKGGIPRSFRLSPRACDLVDGYAWRQRRTQSEVLAMALEALDRELGPLEVIRRDGK